MCEGKEESGTLIINMGEEMWQKKTKIKFWNIVNISLKLRIVANANETDEEFLLLIKTSLSSSLFRNSLVP
jgi:hypothetical protein